MILSIEGTVVFQQLSTGMWGIEGKDGQNYLPINMPDQLKIEGASIRVVVRESHMDSVFMWGTPVEILSFHTIPKF